MRGYSFNTHLQALPAYGYVQFIINYRGSSGYGQAFSDAVVGDMLGGEYRDNREAVDHILETRDYIDSGRMGVYGVSYGGYLTNWVVTQTDRFNAAVSISSRVRSAPATGNVSLSKKPSSSFTDSIPG